MATWISGRTGQFTYFDRRLGGPDWHGKRVLDFGGNVGNLLLDPGCPVEPGDYWCIDVSRDAIEEGRRRNPAAHFVFYDRYNYEYNPTGTPGLPVPDPGVRFDFIVAFGVLGHLSQAEALELVDRLMGMLTGDGRLACTFVDPLWRPPPGWTYESESADSANLSLLVDTLRRVEPDLDAEVLSSRTAESAARARSARWSNLHWWLEKLHAAKPGMDVAGLLARAERAALTWATLVDGDRLVVDPDGPGPPAETAGGPGDRVDHRLWAYISFCTAEHMSRLFPNAEIHPPEDDRQHCVVLDARKGTGRR